MNATERENRHIRLRSSLDVARAVAERLRVTADRSLAALGGEATDDADERSRLVQAAVEAEAQARASAELVRRVEQMLAHEAGMRL